MILEQLLTRYRKELSRLPSHKPLVVHLLPSLSSHLAASSDPALLSVSFTLAPPYLPSPCALVLRPRPVSSSCPLVLSPHPSPSPWGSRVLKKTLSIAPTIAVCPHRNGWETFVSDSSLSSKLKLHRRSASLNLLLDSQSDVTGVCQRLSGQHEIMKLHLSSATDLGSRRSPRLGIRQFFSLGL